MPRSGLSDYVEMAAPLTGAEGRPQPVPSQADQSPGPPTSDAPSGPSTSGAATPQGGDQVTRRRREFAVLLGEFRRTAVLVPVTEDESPLTGDYDGTRWICAFSDESALARFAIARGEGSREWAYRRVLGARLLDVAIPAVGVPCGVALDVGSEGEGVLFPPVVGIVPDAAAVDAEPTEMYEKGSR
nr:hypothetical protein [Streptomyces sp. MMG1533]